MTLPHNEQRIFEHHLEEYEKENDMPFITSIERKGLEKGLEQGREQGREQGLEQGRRDSIVAFLEARFGSLPQKLLHRLGQVHDQDRLLSLTKLAATAPDLASFEVELVGEIAES
jgi:predicted transposase YdaD